MNLKGTAFTFDDVMLVPQQSDISSRKEPDSSTRLCKNRTLSVPIIASPMNTVTEWDMAQTMANIGADSVLHRYMTIEEQCNQFRKINNMQKPWVAVGASGDFLERAEALFRKGATHFCIDVANGHSTHCLEAVKRLRDKFGESISIMAGNVCTAEGVLALESEGVDVVRVGIGPGAMCTTRLVTGFGIPQLSAIEWCSDAAINATIVADGGIRSSGDIVKALAAGADAVMVGGLLAGTDQTPGETVRDDETGHLYKYYHGMASEAGRKEWFSKEATSYVPEGASTKVLHKGDAAKIVKNLDGALRVGMSFANARNLAELRTNSVWVRVTENGCIEGTPNRKLFKG